MVKNGGYTADSRRKAIDSISRKVISGIKPTPEDIELQVRYSNDVMGRLRKALPKAVEIVLAGSTARGTQLRGTSDIDIFLLFPLGTKKELMEKRAIAAAKSIVRRHKNESFVLKYAEHPYLRLYLNDFGIKADIVPAFKISDSSEMGTAVDRTQLHNKFIASRLTESQKDEVRVLKYFLKQHSIYGAEAKTEGFSGYLCELLISHYGSFADFIGAASSLKLPLAVDVAGGKEYGPDGEAVKAAVKKFGKSFVVIDPTDKDRNVAANVSDESLSRFVLAASKLHSRPVVGNFYAGGHSDAYPARQLLALRKGLGIDIYAVSFKVDDIAEDIVWQQLKKLKGRFGKALSDRNFHALLSLQSLEGKDGIIAFFMNPSVVNAVRVDGPSAMMALPAAAFMKSHGRDNDLFLEGDRLFSVEKAGSATAGELMANLLRQKGGLAFPSHISRNGAKVSRNIFSGKHAAMIYRAYAESRL